MNIYKHQYSLVKAELRSLGQKLVNIKYSDDYWKGIVLLFQGNNEKQKNWDQFFSEYLYDCCNEEDRKFIDLYIFQKRSINFVSLHFPLCERACQEWREEHLKNIIGFAMQDGLLYIDMGRFKKDAVS